MEITIRNASAQAPVISGFHGGENDFNKFKQILEEVLGETIAEPVVEINAIHSKLVKVQKKDNTLQIFVWGYFEGKKEYQQGTVDKMWGFANFYKTGLYVPSGEGIPMISPEGKVAAEYFPDDAVLVFLYDAVHIEGAGTTDTIKLFRTIIDEFAMAYYATPRNGQRLTKEELEEKRRIAMAEAKRKAIINLVTSMVEQRVFQLKQTVTTETQRVADYKQSLLGSLRNLDHAQIQLTAFSVNEKEAVEKMTAELDGLVKLKDIVDFDIDGDYLVIKTDTLYFIEKGQRYLVGKFDIKVNINTCDVKFINTTPENRRHSYWGDNCNHPHVAPDGNACLGNIHETIIQLVHQKEWCALAMILKGFIESVNSDDPAGEWYPNWDRVDEKGNIIQKGLNTNDKTDFAERVTCHIGGEPLLERYAHTCPICGEIVCGTHSVYVNDVGYVCDNCMDNDKYAKCPDCDSWFETQTMTKINGTMYCGCCADDHEEEPHEEENVCQFCGKPLDPADAMTCEVCGAQGCPDCIQPNALPNGNAGYVCPEHRGGTR